MNQSTIIYLFVGLERCAGEVVTDMLTIIENCEPDEAQMRLVMRGNLRAPQDFSHFFLWRSVLKTYSLSFSA